MNIKNLLKGIYFHSDADITALHIKAVTDDSRKVKKGGLFIAVKGYAADGNKFIDGAVKAGAKAILKEGRSSEKLSIPVIAVSDIRKALPVIADNFYGHPSGHLKTIGITGTNGKTTITYIIESIVKRSGKDAGVIGTINYRIKGKAIPAKNTTPGSLDLNSMLADMVKRHVGYAVMEVSSHALDQGRVNGIEFDAAIFTNVTGDHLDYHKTMARYLKAKELIFSHLKKDGAAVLNIDDPRVARLCSRLKKKKRILTYGVRNKADIGCRDVELTAEGTAFTLVTPHGSCRVKSGLIGAHNLSNILAAAGASLAVGIGLKHIKSGIESGIEVPGRLEPVVKGQPFNVLVDFAHTEDALKNTLLCLREIVGGRIITVFGCGGDRDRTKRPLMGIAACKLSDAVIITSDNPRSERPQAIISDIVKGVKGRFKNFIAIEDRMDAIRYAITFARPGDIVLLAGKGHETYQIIGDKVISFDDRIAAADALALVRYGRKVVRR